MANKHTRRTANQQASNVLSTDLAFRGNRHQVAFWDKLLPSARKRMVEAGLFTDDGKITPLGLAALKDME